MIIGLWPRRCPGFFLDIASALGHLRVAMKNVKFRAFQGINKSEKISQGHQKPSKMNLKSYEFKLL
jgi:hypothetical protein